MVTAFVCISEMGVCVSVTALHVSSDDSWCSCQVNRIKSKPTHVNMLCMVSMVHTVDRTISNTQSAANRRLSDADSCSAHEV